MCRKKTELRTTILKNTGMKRATATNNFSRRLVTKEPKKIDVFVNSVVYK